MEKLNPGMKLPVCMGIHIVFAAKAYEKLTKTGREKVITCNAIAHP